MSCLHYVYVQNPNQPHKLWSSNAYTCLYDAMCGLMTLNHAMDHAGMMNRQKPLMYIEGPSQPWITMSPNGRWWECNQLPDGRKVASERPFVFPEGMNTPIAVHKPEVLDKLPGWAFAWSAGIWL